MIFGKDDDGAYIIRCGSEDDPCNLNYTLMPPETADEEVLTEQAREAQSEIVARMKRIRDRVLGQDD